METDWEEIATELAQENQDLRQDLEEAEHKIRQLEDALASVDLAQFM